MVINKLDKATRIVQIREKIRGSEKRGKIGDMFEPNEPEGREGLDCYHYVLLLGLINLIRGLKTRQICYFFHPFRYILPIQLPYGILYFKSVWLTNPDAAD